MKALKLGGSVITNKHKYKKPDKNQIKRIINEIKDHYKEIILVHGAGSFGHPIVKENKLEKGIKTEKQRNSIIEVQNSVKELNKLFIDLLKKENIPCMVIHPSSCFTTKNDDIQTFGGLEPIKIAYEQDILPIMYGDLVLDQEKGVSVLSGDKIITFLAKELPIEKIGMGARSAVLDSEKNPIKKITRFDSSIFQETKSVDVTGGMSYKVKQLLKIKQPSYIFDATKEKNIKKFLSDEEIGTEVIYNDNKK